MRKIRILGTGVPTMDIYPAHKEMFPGGNEYNIACNVALLGEEAGFLGVFARDLAAGYLQDTLKNLGVDMCACRREKGSSGYSLVELKEDGDRIFLMWNQEGAADKNPIQFTEEELQYIETFDVLCAGRQSLFYALLWRRGAKLPLEREGRNQPLPMMARTTMSRMSRQWRQRMHWGQETLLLLLFWSVI